MISDYCLGCGRFYGYQTDCPVCMEALNAEFYKEQRDQQNRRIRDITWFLAGMLLAFLLVAW